MGLLTATTLLALLSTPPLFGLIFDLTGSYNGHLLDILRLRCCRVVLGARNPHAPAGGSGS